MPSNKTFTSDFGCQYSGLRGTGGKNWILVGWLFWA